MGLFLFLLILFIVFVGGGWVLGKGVGNFLFPDEKEKETYIDKSVNYHYHTVINNTNHNTMVNHDHKQISIIDPETKKDILNLKTTKTDEKTFNNT